MEAEDFPAEGGESRGSEEEGVGDLLGPFSDETGSEEAPRSSKQSFKSYGVTSYGATENARESATNRPGKQRELILLKVRRFPVNYWQWLMVPRFPSKVLAEGS